MKRIIAIAMATTFAVLAKPAAQAATYGQEVVAAVLLAEARSEGLRGMQAVAEVIRTRADKKGVSMLAVVKPGAFTSLNGTDRDRLLRKFHKHPMFPEALKIARRAYNEPERMSNLTRNATHYVVKNEKPWWAKGRYPVAVVGKHAFYRLARF